MSTTTDSTYPAQYETSVILKDGSAILFRPIRITDTENWLNFYHRLSKRTIYMRLQYNPPDMGIEDAIRFCTVDYINSFAFVAEAIEEQQNRIVAVGRYSRLPEQKTAEIAFVIEDKYQDKGITTKLIEWLATVARNNDIDTFEAYVLAENKNMMSVFQDYGFHMKKKLENNVYHITFPLTKTPEVVKKKDERLLFATLNSLRHIMKPRSVAVIGASNRPGVIGQQVFQSVLQSGFAGVAYPISPTWNSVMSVKTYPSVLDVPGEVDLGIIVVPSAQVLKVIDECGRKKVKGVVVISDGFKERGEEGAVLERELRKIAFGYGMRIIGPNCMGLMNTDSSVKLNATFSPIFPPQGNIAFVTQSGALGLGVLEFARNLGIGFSSYVSVGNRADIASTDLMQYWEKDPNTKVILLYLESIDNPDIFSRISKRVSSSKPVLAIKGGNTTAGSRASRSHTGAMTTSETVADALFQQAGIVKVKSIVELFDTAILLAYQPVPRGRRVAILTNGGGPGILAADACSQNGLILPELSEETVKKLKAAVKRDVNINNPIDLTAAGGPQEFEDILKILAEDPDIDSIMSIYVPAAGLTTKDIEEGINKAADTVYQSGKPLLVCFVGFAEQKGKAMEGNRFVPYYLFPEDAALALANAARYAELSSEKRGSTPVFNDINKEKSKQIFNSVLTGTSQRPLWVPVKEMSEIFKSYGIHLEEMGFASTAKEAAEISARLGFPVAAKLDSKTITHKTDVGGVILNLNSEAEVENAFNEIRNRLKKTGRENEMSGLMLQHMITEGSEVIVGVAEDSYLGHIMMFGLGGIYAELIKDTAVRLHPLTDLDAGKLIDSVKMSQLLKGYRGSEPLDIESLKDLLLRLSALIEDMPHITEMDLNPVKVLPEGKGYSILDARMLIK